MSENLGLSSILVKGEAMVLIVTMLGAYFLVPLGVLLARLGEFDHTVVQTRKFFYWLGALLFGGSGLVLTIVGALLDTRWDLLSLVFGVIAGLAFQPLKRSHKRRRAAHLAADGSYETHGYGLRRDRVTAAYRSEDPSEY